MTNTTPLATLVAFLNEHDCGVTPTVQGLTADGRLRVSSAYSDGSTSTDTIDATLSAAREWLGY